VTRRAWFGTVVVMGLAGGNATAQHHAVSGTAQRSGFVFAQVDPGPSTLDTPTWVFPASDPSVTGNVRFVDQASPVVEGPLVYAVSVEPPAVWAITRESGVAAWSAGVDAPVLDSWSSPAIDPVNRTVIVASGSPGPDAGVLAAFDLSAGGSVWSVALPRDVVNASPVVTTDLGPADRVFITDYEGFFAGGSGAMLHCVNVDPFHSTLNPHQPGDVVWSAPLRSGATGASPAYHRGRVFVATAGDFGGGQTGEVICFNAGAADAPSAELWRTTPPGDDGFSGGVSVRGIAVYAASYDFFGGPSSSRLVRLDAVTGQTVWQTPAARTSSTPIALPDGRIVLSGGIAGFGSVPTVQVFRDDGAAAVKIADVALDTWQDDGDGVPEPGELDVVGGWAHQPLVTVGSGGTRLFVGEPTITGGLFTGNQRLRAIDLDVPFGAPGFVISASSAAGASPAVVGRTLYSVGLNGIAAFGLPDRPDVNQDGRVGTDDLEAWSVSGPGADVNRDGTADDLDRLDLERIIRRDDPERGRGVRP
jgi:outer membrane protein assembly factor BamB